MSSPKATPSPAPRMVPCPACGQDAPFAPSNRWRPFCSERCRRIDLGAWASERYRVPAKPSIDEDHDESVPPARPAPPASRG